MVEWLHKRRGQPHRLANENQWLRLETHETRSCAATNFLSNRWTISGLPGPLPEDY
jgi:hypothetical protein